MPSTGSRPSGSRVNRQLRSSWIGSATAREIADSNPRRRRAIIARLAHGQARLTISRYRPASTGHPSEPSAVIRSTKWLGDRLNSGLFDVSAPISTLSVCAVGSASASG